MVAGNSLSGALPSHRPVIAALSGTREELTGEAAGKGADVVDVALGKDGRIIHISASISPIFDAGG